MKSSFENLDVRKKAFELTKELWVIFYHIDFKNISFQDQMMRCALGVPNNIAQWHDRGENNDYDIFIYRANSAAAETKNMVYMAFELWYLTEEQKTYFAEKIRALMVQLSRLTWK